MRKLIIKLNVDEHLALRSLVRERCRVFETLEAIEEVKILEDATYCTPLILGASRKAKTFRLAYCSLLDSLDRYDECEDESDA